MAAVAAFETAGEPYPLAYAWLRLAEVYAMAGQRSAAARAAMQAQVTAGRIGADPIAAEVAALARRARLTPDGLPGGDATAAEARQTAGPVQDSPAVSVKYSGCWPRDGRTVRSRGPFSSARRP